MPKIKGTKSYDYRNSQKKGLMRTQRDDEQPQQPIGQLQHQPIVGRRPTDYTTEMVNAAFKFDNMVSEIKFNSCRKCPRSFLGLKINSDNVCVTCQKVEGEYKFSAHNLMDPGTVPPELQNLTNMEQMLIARIHPVVTLFRIRNAQVAYKGNVINFRQDICSYSSVLPHHPSELSSVILFSKDTPSGSAYFQARADTLRQALVWLKRYNGYYSDIVISEENLNFISQNSDLTSFLSTMVESDTIDSDRNEGIDESFVPLFDPVDQQEQISNVLHLPYPKKSSTPINEFKEEGYIAKAFPVLFPYGNADLNQCRTVKLTADEYFKFLLEYNDDSTGRRFANDSRFRFFAFNSLMRRQANSQIGVYMQRGTNVPLTVQEIRDRLENDPNFLKQVMVYCSNLRSTNPYWFQRCGELLDMVHQLGMPTLFFTLSAADYHWPDLFRLLKPGVDPSLISETERQKLMHDNPAIVAYFFQERCNLYIEHVLTPILGVQDSWFRFEWQWRGSPHLHGLLWLSDSPTLNLPDLTDANLEEIRQYFDLICVAINPNLPFDQSAVHPSRKRFSDVAPEDWDIDLNSLLNNFQRHTHCGTHCLRNANGVMLCRFKFPFETREVSCIDDLLGYLQFVPKRNDPLMQKHNPYMAHTWRANIDTSVIVSLKAVLKYIAKYASKGEYASKSFIDILKGLINSKASNDSSKKTLQSMIITHIGDRNYSGQEVEHLVRGYPLYRSSRQFVKLNFSSQKWFKLTVNADTTESLKESASIFDKYRERTLDMEHLSLLEYAKTRYYDRGFYRKRRKNAVVRVFPKLQLNGDPEKDELFYQQQVILNVPFIGKDFQYSDLLKGQTVNEQFDSWHDKFQSLNIDINIGRFELPEEEDEGLLLPEGPDGREVVEPFMMAARMQTQQVEQPELGNRMIDLTHEWVDNSQQYSSIETVKEWLKTYQQHTPQLVSNESVGDFVFSNEQQNVLNIAKSQLEYLTSGTGNPLKQVVVQGKAGSGKSTVIKEIVRMVNDTLGEGSIEIAAPTGAAAVNINGKTVHSLLHFFDINTYKPLTAEKLREFQIAMQNVKFIIIDEMSMIGCKMLYTIQRRCCEAKSYSNAPFGGLMVFLFGDFGQLPPVNDIALFNDAPCSGIVALGKTVFDNFDKFIELQLCHRQQGDAQSGFRTALDHVSYGKVTQEDFELLMSRRIGAVFCYCDNFGCMRCNERKSFETAPKIFRLNDLVTDANKECLSKTGNPVARLLAVSKPNIASTASEDKAMGLEQVLYLSVGCRVVLNRNLWVSGGLVNGSPGIVIAIVYASGVRPPALPDYVLVKFDTYKGVSFFPDQAGVFPVVPAHGNWKHGDISCSRKQFPLSLGHAFTIHKAQGFTLPKAVVNIGDKEMPVGLSYVALSRVRKLTDLVIDGFHSKERFDSIGNMKTHIAKMAFLNKYWPK